MGRAPLSTEYFRTPESITCDYFSGEAQYFPFSRLLLGTSNANFVGTSSGLSQTNDPIAYNGQIYGQSLKTVPPLHSIIVDGVLCGVDDSGTTACKDLRGHGFALSPHDSGWLTHVRVPFARAI